MEATRMAAAVLLCCVLLATSPPAALGNCRDECIAGCNGWPLICQLSCSSACLGQVGISTLSTAGAPATNSASASAAAPQLDEQQQQGGGVSPLRGLKPKN